MLTDASRNYIFHTAYMQVIFIFRTENNTYISADASVRLLPSTASAFIAMVRSTPLFHQRKCTETSVKVFPNIKRATVVHLIALNARL